MDNKSHIALVYAHTKGNCGNNNLDLVVHPVSLDLLATGIRQLCVVKIALYTIVAL